MAQQSENRGILLESATNEVEFLLVRLQDQRYGINVAKICQIMLFDPEAVAELPNQHKSMVGVTTFRDKSISVVDLRSALGLPARANDSKNVLLLVTEFNERTLGFVIDAVDKIERCSWDMFEPLEKTVSNNKTGSVLGTVTLKDGIVVIVDLETIISGIDPTASIEFYKDKIDKIETDRENVSIVCCEDSPMMQKFLVSAFKAAGFDDIAMFSNGEDGLNYVANKPASEVDLIVSDIEMPQKDGLTFCKQVKTLDGYQNVPVIFFSSTINEQMQAKCKSVGGEGAFSKPQVQLMVSSIEKLLKRKRADRQ